MISYLNKVPGDRDDNGVALDSTFTNTNWNIKSRHLGYVHRKRLDDSTPP